MLGKMLPKEWRERKTKIPYEIEVTGSRFKLELTFNLPLSWYSETIQALVKRGKKIKMKDHFQIDPRMKGFANRQVEDTVRKVVKEVREDKPNFAIHSTMIKDMRWVVKDETVFTKMWISGLCSE